MYGKRSQWKHRRYGKSLYIGRALIYSLQIVSRSQAILSSCRLLQGAFVHFHRFFPFRQKTRPFSHGLARLSRKLAAPTNYFHCLQKYISLPFQWLSVIPVVPRAVVAGFPHKPACRALKSCAIVSFFAAPAIRVYPDATGAGKAGYGRLGRQGASKRAGFRRFRPTQPTPV